MKLKIGNLEFYAEPQRWPWQKGYNWRGMTKSAAPLNPGGARFGGGWDFALGLRLSAPGRYGFSAILELGFGMIRLGWRNIQPSA